MAGWDREGGATHCVCGQIDLRLERHADERENLAGAVLEGRHPPHLVRVRVRVRVRVWVKVRVRVRVRQAPSAPSRRAP